MGNMRRLFQQHEKLFKGTKKDKVGYIRELEEGQLFLSSGYTHGECL